MQFGMILLVLVIACSVAGSMIVQQREPMEYVNRYGSTAAQVILGLGLDNVFSAPYFFILMGALCLNLLLCSVVRFPRTMKVSRQLIARAAQAEAEHPLTPSQAEKLAAYLRRSHYRRT